MTNKERVLELLTAVDNVNFDIARVEEYVKKNKYSYFRGKCQKQTLPLLRIKRQSIIRGIAEETDNGEVVRLSREVCNEQ
jgi:hypothetical protein